MFVLLLLIFTVVFDVLLFEALPLVAEPPVVFPLTLALPELALWLFEFVTVTVLLLFTFTDELLLDVTVLLLPKPVLEIVEVLVAADATLPTSPATPTNPVMSAIFLAVVILPPFCIVTVYPIPTAWSTA